MQSSWSWPFGRVELGDSELVAYSPLFGERWAVHIPYSEIALARVIPVRLLGGKVRLQRRSPTEGDVTIVTLGDAYTLVEARLNEHEVPVEHKVRRENQCPPPSWRLK